MRKPLALLLLVTAALALSACGNKPQIRTEGLTEGTYLNVGPLTYQVQISRQLNPHDIQDRSYLVGIPAAQQGLKPDEVWFGVFLRVENETGLAHPPANDIQIVDTQEESFRPVPLNVTNLFAYRSTSQVPANEVVPLPDTPAFDTPIRGALVLFKLTLTSLGNRPLELHIVARTGRQQTGIIDLDV